MPAPKGNKYAVGNDGGRESSYSPDILPLVEKFCRLGATDIEVADMLGVCVRTVYRWKAEHEEFSHALKVGKDASDERVVNSLYARATGYQHPEDKVFMVEGEPVVVPTTKHYPPDATSALFWLKNRRPDEWRDKKEVEDVTPDDSATVRSTKDLARAVGALMAETLANRS